MLVLAGVANGIVWDLPEAALPTSRRGGCCLRRGAYAEKMFLAAQEELALTNGGGSEGLFAEIIFRNEIELRTGFDDVHFAFVVEEVNVVLG